MEKVQGQEGNQELTQSERGEARAQRIWARMGTNVETYSDVLRLQEENGGKATDTHKFSGISG